MASPERQQESSAKLERKTDDGDRKPGPISFGFSKTITKTKAENVVEKDFLTGVEGKELKSVSAKPVEEKKEIIIPLIKRNRWHKEDGTAQSDKERDKRKSPSQDQDSVESQAVRELIEESQKQQERWNSDSQIDPNFSIPLLMQNQAPEGFEEGTHLNVGLRPESSTEADYEQVPVEAYGLAMLKGMGWNEAQGMGRTFQQNIKPVEHQLRPKSLGLGADRSAINGPEQKNSKPKEERKEEDEELVLGPGRCVQVQAGVHKDRYGKVEGVDVENTRVVVKLAILGTSVTVSQHHIRLVHQKEYDKYSKDLSRLSKAHKEKEREKEREQQEKEQKKSGSKDRDETRRDRYSERRQEEKRKKDRETSGDREKSSAPKQPRISPPNPSWLQRDLRVRFIDKGFKGGKYYKSKMRIEDVLTPYLCVCRTDEGRLLDDVKQSMLETIIPKGDGDMVMVVLGEHRGRVGSILQRDKERCRAVVQLECYEDQLFKLDYDSICHYVGGTH